MRLANSKIVEPEESKGRKDDGQVIKVSDDLQIIWFDKNKVKDEDMNDLQ